MIVEAMACGCPVVSTKCPYGPEEIITDGLNGFLSQPCDKKELAGHIFHVLSDSELKESLIENGYKRAMEFTDIKSAENYIEVINKCWCS